MGFITETVSSLADLVTKIDAFLTAEGWTQDQLNTGAGKWATHLSTSGTELWLSARWDTASPNALGLYQALGFVGTGTDPGNHTDDSGNGQVSGTDATLQTGRHILLTNAPLKYWGFASSYYAHFVVQVTATIYRHFAIGQIAKLGDFTGGEYLCGFRHTTSSTTTKQMVGFGTTTLLDGLAKDDVSPDPANMEAYVATMHVEGLPNQPGSGKWAVCMGNQGSADLGLDRASNDRLHVVGGYRAGKLARTFGRFPGTSLMGLMPGYPIIVSHWDRTTGNDRILGFMKDARGISVEFWSGGDTIIIDGDTWHIFPSFAKYSGSGSVVGTSGYQGIMYMEVP